MSTRPNTPPTSSEATQQALAILAVDNLRPSQHCIELMLKIDRGEITYQQAIDELLQKAASYADAHKRHTVP